MVIGRVENKTMTEERELDFSIITPNLNYGRYLRDCLASVAGQEGISLEHLVIDGGSTDTSEGVVGEFSHAEFIQEPDEGMSDGINKGFAKACGKWVMWLNADDRLKPGALAALKKFAGEHPSADVIYGGWDFVDQDGEKIRSMTLMPFQRLTLIYLGCYIGSTATFLRRATTIQEGLVLNKRYKVVMDGEYYCRLAQTGKKFVYFHRLLADFRLHATNLSLRNQEVSSLDGILSREGQFAESRSLKRFYGWKMTGIPMVDTAIDTPLFYCFLVRKAISKRFFALRNRLQ